MFDEESEARKKLCPFAALNNLIVGNLADAESNYCCKASDCMMWRWTIEYERIPGTEEADSQGRGFWSTIKYWLWDVLVKEPLPFNSVYQRRTPARGYCGLAGKLE